MGRVGKGVCFIDCSFYSSWSSTSSPESPEIGPRKKEARRDNVPGRMCPQEKDGQVTFAFLIVQLPLWVHTAHLPEYHAARLCEKVFPIVILFISQLCDPGVFRPLCVRRISLEILEVLVSWNRSL